MIAPAQPLPIFHRGQLVCHRRYGYRGVIVEIDECCMAPDEWYESNKTQPVKNQPWYHVLVSNTTSSTYAAETSLIEDNMHEPIIHPLIDEYFSNFDGAQYERNRNPWSGW